MSFEFYLSIISAVFLFFYLCYSIAKPEKF